MRFAEEGRNASLPATVNMGAIPYREGLME